MKKVLSFIILMVCAVTGAWAQGGTTIQIVGEGNGIGFQFNVNNDPDLSSINWTIDHGNNWIETVNDGVGSYHIADNGGVVKFCGDAVNASAIERLINAKNDQGQQLWANHKANGVIDVSEITLTGEISTLPAHQTAGQYVISGLIYTNNTALPDWVNGSNFKYALSNGTTDSYLYATEDQTTLPSGLTIVNDGSVTYHLTGGGAEDLANILINSHNVPEANVIYTAIPKGSFTYDHDKKIVYVHTPIAGQFTTLFNKEINYANDYKGYTFKFDSESVLSEADLLTLVGDQTYQSNMYYVDLFDVPATEALCYWDDPDHPEKVGIITKVIKEIRNRNSSIESAYNCYQFRGLILPKDHTVYGSGTTLIQGQIPRTAGQLATCSEFIVYHKTLQEDGTAVDNKLTVAHIYNVQSNGAITSYQDAYDKMMTLLKDHEDIEETDIYQISTNFQMRSDNGNYTKIDITKETTGLPTSKAIVETYNNEMVGATSIANMVSHPVNAGDFATSATATGMMNTPTEKLTIIGPMKKTDFSAISNFTTGNGPRVLDLRAMEIDENETMTLEQLLALIANDAIEYIVLPENTDKSVIFADYNTSGHMPNLKAVINAAPAVTIETDNQGNQQQVHSQPTIVANIYEAGSLYEARIHALDLASDYNGVYHLYNSYGVESVTLKGTLNAADITAQVNTGSGCHLDANGHWSTEVTTDLTERGLLGETGIKSFDLEQAVFPYVLVKDGKEYVQEDMNFWKSGHQYLENVKLPTSSSMTTLPAHCFDNIKTLVSLCIPANYLYVRELCFHNCLNLKHVYTTPSDGLEEGEEDHGMGTITLPAGLLEIEGGAFSFVDNNNPGITDVYVLSKEAPKCAAHAFSPMMTFGNNTYKLEHPYSREMYKADGHIMTLLHFPNQLTEAQKKKYTDVTRKYSLVDETGDTDADGNPMVWPTQEEFNRAFMQGNVGYLWDQWPARNETTGVLDNSGCTETDGENYGGFWYSYDGHDSAYAFEHDSNDFGDYLGWHEFALCGSGYFYDIVVQDEIEYYELDWYTLCIPYDLTPEMVAKAVGVQYVDGLEKTLHRMNGMNETVNADFYPELRTFTAITHDLSNGNIKLSISSNLSKAGELKTFSVDEYHHGQISELGTNAPLIKGGYPYIIRPIVPKSVYDELTTKFNGAGRYLMSKIVDKTDLPGYQKSFTLGENTVNVNVPCENHQIIAVGKNNGENLTETIDGQVKPYLYNFMGTYTERPMPKYSYYLGVAKSGVHKFFRSTTDKKTWNAYSAIIAPLGEATFEVKTVDQSQTVVMIYSGTHDDTRTINAGSRFEFVFADGGVVDLTGTEDETTGIDTLDGEIVSIPAGKVFNLSGQYVGSAVDGLAKGIYIVKGKKIVVR